MYFCVYNVLVIGILNFRYIINLFRYLMVSAQAQIEGYRTGYPEILSVTYEHPDFTYNVSPYSTHVM